MFGFKKDEPVKPVEIVTKPVERTPLAVALPPPLSVKPIEWRVITEENAKEVFDQLRQDKVDVVLIGLTDDGYKNLAVTVTELRNLMAQYREILIQYQNYYEPKKKAEPEAEKK